MMEQHSFYRDFAEQQSMFSNEYDLELCLMLVNVYRLCYDLSGEQKLGLRNMNILDDCHHEGMNYVKTLFDRRGPDQYSFFGYMKREKPRGYYARIRQSYDEDPGITLSVPSPDREFFRPGGAELAKMKYRNMLNTEAFVTRFLETVKDQLFTEHEIRLSFDGIDLPSLELHRNTGWNLFLDESVVAATIETTFLSVVESSVQEMIAELKSIEYEEFREESCNSPAEMLEFRVREIYHKLQNHQKSEMSRLEILTLEGYLRSCGDFATCNAKSRLLLVLRNQSNEFDKRILMRILRAAWLWRWLIGIGAFLYLWYRAQRDEILDEAATVEQNQEEIPRRKRKLKFVLGLLIPRRFREIGSEFSHLLKLVGISLYGLIGVLALLMSWLFIAVLMRFV